MRTIAVTLASILGLFAGTSSQAQGTTYISNFGQGSAGIRQVGSDAWLAEAFFTGTNSQGYALNSVRLLMAPASGSPSGFSVSIFDNYIRVPSSPVATLTGPAPSAGGAFTYQASGTTLQERRLYFVVVTAGTPTTSGAFAWTQAASNGYMSSQSWELGDFRYSSVDGSTWVRQGGGTPNQFEINATAIPEPGSGFLWAIGLLMLLCARWRN